MAKSLGISEAEFLERHTRLVGTRRSLNERETAHGFDCVFLDRLTRPGMALCSVYTGRPSQCRTWPFWPSNLSSARAWAHAKAKTPCPGMGSGPIIPVEQIRIMRDIDDRDNSDAPW